MDDPLGDAGRTGGEEGEEVIGAVVGIGLLVTVLRCMCRTRAVIEPHVAAGDLQSDHRDTTTRFVAEKFAARWDDDDVRVE